MPAFRGAKAGLTTTELDEGKGSSFIGRGREPWLSKPKVDQQLKRIQQVLLYFFIWVFPKIGVPQNGWFIMEQSLSKWMILGENPPIKRKVNFTK